MERLTNYYINKNGCRMYERADNSVKNQHLIDKLGKYEDAEEKGLLLKTKCKPGDYVYEANFKRNIVSEYEVSSIRYGINKTFHYMWVLRKGIYSNLDGFRDDDIGKTVFLIQSEAEQKLKEMER